MDITDIQNLRAKGTPRGRLIHLVRLGEGTTLCGKDHGLNVRYLDAKYGYTLHPSKADCPKCIAIVGVEIPAEPRTVEDVTAQIQRAERNIATLDAEIRATTHHRRKLSLIEGRDAAEQGRAALVTELGALQQEQNR